MGLEDRCNPVTDTLQTYGPELLSNKGGEAAFIEDSIIYMFSYKNKIMHKYRITP